jgi:putative alpha-1,2-mannosidase
VRGARLLDAALAAILLVSFGCQSKAKPLSVSSEVKPLIGTGGLGYGVGSVPAGATYPFGLAKPGPDTATDGRAPDFEHCAGYWYEDQDIRGFSQLHLEGVGLPDYGILMLMPVLDLPSGAIDETFYTQHIDHHLEPHPERDRRRDHRDAAHLALSLHVSRGPSRKRRREPRALPERNDTGLLTRDRRR